jgi:hypothetical protein
MAHVQTKWTGQKNLAGTRQFFPDSEKYTKDPSDHLPFLWELTPTFLVGIVSGIRCLLNWGFLKYLTFQLVLRKQIRPLKRRFHAASLRGSCGSPLGSTSNPRQIHSLRKRAPRKPEGGRGRVKSQILILGSVF